MSENHSDNIAIIINHHDECSQDNTAPTMAAEMAPKESVDNQIDQSQTVNINLNGDEVQNGNVSPLKGASDEFSQKLIIEKIENLNLENHELKAENGEFKSKIDHLEKICSQLKTKSERSTAQIESSKRELQSMVIKYATSEREVINLKKHYNETERKCKDLLKDKELLQTQIKQLNNEKKQLTINVEKRVLESASLQNENELLKNKLEQADVKIQQLQVQLAQVNGQFKIANEKLNRIESGLGKFNLNVSSESISENSVDQINEERTDDDQSEGVDEAKDKTNCTDQFLKCVEENGLLIKQIEQLESQNVDYQNKIAELDLKLSDANLEVADYQRKVLLIESLKQELINKQTAIEELKHQFDRINSINRDLVGDIDSSKHKEAELLEYTERLTAKLVSLQSEHNNLIEKLKSTQLQSDQFKSNLDQILVEKDEIKSKYDALKTGTDQKIKELTDKLDVKISESNELHQKIDQLENDIKIIKRRHILNLKELNKEIQSLKKQRELDPPNIKLNQQQRPQTQHTNETANSSTLSSRTSSFNSLSELSNSVVDTSQSVPTTEMAFNSGHRTNPNASNGNSDASAPTAIPSTLTSSSSSTLSATNNNCQSSATTTSSSSSSTSELITSLNDIDKTVLVERILRLQRTLIKRNEKVDFLEEHNEQLTEEVRKKSKLLQYYILKEETGALATETMDKNKAYISKRGGGIMSSLYNSSSTDDSMTLERSLEINNKLHAVLEDTLLKNMTLKENLNTLAQEIDRLSKSKK